MSNRILVSCLQQCSALGRSAVAEVVLSHITHYRTLQHNTSSALAGDVVVPWLSRACDVTSLSLRRCQAYRTRLATPGHAHAYRTKYLIIIF